MKTTNLKNTLLMTSLVILGVTQANAYTIEYHKGFWGTIGFRNTFKEVKTKVVAHAGADGLPVIDQVDVYCKGSGLDDCEANIDIKPNPNGNSYPELEINFANNMVAQATTQLMNGVSNGGFSDALVIAKPDGSLITINFTITWTSNSDGSADFIVNRIEN